MKCIKLFVFVAVAVLTNGCSAQTTKNLTEITARNLMTDFVRIHKVVPTLSLGHNAQGILVPETTVDYSKSLPTVLMKRMLDNKYLVQTSVSVLYPKINRRLTTHLRI